MDDRIRYHGAFLYPRVWIGDKHQLNFLTKDQYSFEHAPAFIYQYTYNDLTVYVTVDGFLLAEVEDSVEALNFYNYVVLSMNLCDLYTSFITPSQLINVGSPGDKFESSPRLDIDRVTSDFHARTFEPDFKGEKVTRNLRLVEEKKLPWLIENKGRNRYLSPDNLKIIIANALLLREVLPINVRDMLIQAKSHLEDEEYNQSLLVSWILIESIYGEVWEKRLNGFSDSAGLSNTKRKELMDSIGKEELFISKVTNLLFFLGEIDNTTIGLLNRIRRKRNDFVHNNKPVRKKDTEEALDLAIDIVRTYYSALTNITEINSVNNG